MPFSAVTAATPTTQVLYVAAVHPLAEEEERHSWGIDDSGAVSDRQICLRLLVRADGTIVAATDGTGFRPGAPVGALYGVDGESLPGATLDGILELMAAVVNNAQKYDATATPQHVLRGFLWRLALTHIAARVVSFRSGVLCPGGDPGVVPGRVVVVPAHLYGLDLAAMEAAGVVTKKAADAVRRGRMYVVECWSAAWLSGELEAASDDTVRVVNTHLGLITGRADGHMLGRKIGDVLEESERAQLVLREAKRGGRGMEVGVRHFDGGAVACSVTGAQAASGRKHTCLLLRATLEEPESGMESLRRVEVLMMSAESAGTPSATASAMTPRARRRVKAESRGDASSAGGRGGRSAGERGGDEDSGAPSADARRAIGRGRGRGWVERAAAKKGEESTSRSGQSATPRSVSPAPTGVVEAVGGEGKWASAREEEEEEEGEERGAEEAGEEGKVEKGGGLGGLLRKRSVSFRGAKGYGFEEVDLKEMRKENREEEGREEEVLSGSESSWETWSDEEEDEEEEEVAKSRAAVATVAATLFARKRTLGGGVDAGDDGDVAEEDESAHVAAEGLQRAERFRRLQRLLREAQVASMGKSLKKRTLAVVLVALAANLSIFGAFLAR